MTIFRPLVRLLGTACSFAAILVGLDRLGLPNIVAIFCALLGAIFVEQALARWLQRRAGG